MKSEGELASVLARGIAHTAMRSLARLYTRGTLLEMASVPGGIPVAIDIVPHAPADNHIAVQTFGSLKFQREFEFEADYFAIQYVYKAGYDTDCFLNAVQSLWQPDYKKGLTLVFDPFPPLPLRLKKLHQEIDDILPEQSEAVVSNSEFDQFIGHLAQIAPPAPKPIKPKLIRHEYDSSSE